MVEVLGSRFNELCSCLAGTPRPKSVARFVALASALLIPSLSVSAQQAAQAKKNPQGTAAPAAAQPATPPPPPPAQIWLPPLQNPEHTPDISWDGQLLTIDAENSSLAQIMLGIRARTGASVEMPSSASRERVAVHLGPAPIRDVLSALLYGTDFNYVIQSTEDDDTALQKVVLIGRDGADGDSMDTFADDTQPKGKIRLMPGYAAPGKRDFEVAHSNLMDDNSSGAAESAPADSSAQNADQPAATPADSGETNKPINTQPVAANSESTDGSSSSPDASSLAASDMSIRPGTNAAVENSASIAASGSGGSSSISMMEQNLQNMYQKRQQLQAQQNHATQTPAP